MAERADEEISKLGVNDEIGQEIEGEFKEQLEKELSMHIQNHSTKIDTMERFKKQLARDTRMWDLMLQDMNYKRVTPMFKYETLDEYWELAKGQLEDKITQEKYLSESRLKHMETEIIGIQEQITDCEEQLKKLNQTEVTVEPVEE